MQRRLLTLFANWLAERNRIKPSEVDQLVTMFLDDFREANR